MTESELMRLSMVEASHRGWRLFRMNSGVAWVGEHRRFTRLQEVFVEPGDVLIKRARRFRAGIPGISDLIGWKPGGPAQFVAREIKSPSGRATPEQIAFIDAVNRAGGDGKIIRSVDEL